ncbi:MAG: hypothetical protein JW836_06765 [Deltaproteobacteria bacterium]|nr:hypothetical protein [Deltaproteobacteria bacterium]
MAHYLSIDLDEKRNFGMKLSQGAEIVSQIADSEDINPIMSRHVAAPSLFRHGSILTDSEGADELDRSALTNMLNHIHFTDRFVQIMMGHPQYKETLLLRAFPEPCMGSRLICTWADDSSSSLDLRILSFRYLVVDDGRSIILAPGVMHEISPKHIAIELPEKSFVHRQRKARRFMCHGVTAELFQSGFHACGEMVEFNPTGFRIRVTPDPSCSFRWLNSEENAMIKLQGKEKLLFSESCRLIRQEGGDTVRDIVLSPLYDDIRRFRKKPCRNLRQDLNPRPKMLFTHPFLGNKVDLEISDISTSGFSVCEETEERLLSPGIILPELTINFAGLLKINCSAQVIYSKPTGEGSYRCGLAILNMDIHAYSSLAHVLAKALDPCANVSSDINVDALWEFFFETGFIYPKKYRVIQHQRAKFKETYKRLYQDGPEVARHFTYQKNGRIYGHISMVRAYERAWMVHHHAAKAMRNQRTGFMVLKLIMHYLNDMHRLPSTKMDYAMCYFRPENKFPDRVFGGFARELNDSRGCSLDLFGYLPYTRLSLSPKLPEGWTLNPASDLDLWEYERIYKDQSNGLLLDALGLVPGKKDDESIEEVYARLNLFRKCRAFSLRYKQDLSAILVSNRTDFGFNLSELLNGIKILVARGETLPWSVLSVAVAQLASDSHLERIPLLFYPISYVDCKDIPCEKNYQLWILNVQSGNEYMEYVQRRFHISYKQIKAPTC